MGSPRAERSSRVRVVTINWNAAELTARCLRSLLATEWPLDDLDLVVVDNASFDGSLERLRAWFADEPVRFLTSSENLGFAEGCNIAMRDLASIDHVALVNNDAVVEPGWLAPLVQSLDGDPGLGAVSPKLLLATPYSDLIVDAAPGSEVVAVEVDGLDVTGRCLWGSGVETVPDRTVPLLLRHRVGVHSSIAVPVPPDPERLVQASLLLSTDEPFQLDGGNGCRQPGVSEERGTRATVTVTSPATWRVNNLGTGRTQWNEGLELRFGQPDDPSVGPEEPLGWCGGGVLLRADYLRDVGRFDPKFFAYYEDTDLSWRGRRAGWRYRTEPRSVLHHVHGGSAGSTARGFFLLNYRNWLLTALRNGDRQEIADTLRWARRAVWGATYVNVVEPLRQLQRPHLTLSAAWVGVALTTAAGAPRALLSRRAGAGRRIGTTPTRRVRSILQSRPAPRPPTPRVGGPAVVYIDATAALGAGAGAEVRRATLDLLRRLPLLADVDAVGLIWSEVDARYRRLSSAEWAHVLEPGSAKPAPASAGRAAPPRHPARRRRPGTARLLVLPKWEQGAVFLDVGASRIAPGAPRRSLLPQLGAAGVRIVWFAIGGVSATPPSRGGTDQVGTFDEHVGAHIDHADAIICDSADAAARVSSLVHQRRPDRTSGLSISEIDEKMPSDRAVARIASTVVGLTAPVDTARRPT